MADPDSAGTAERIVVGVDGSPQSKQALRRAASIAAKIGGRLDAVLIWQPPVVLEHDRTNVAGDRNPQALGEKHLTAVVDEVFGACRPPQLHLVVAQGHPARGLMDHAEGATMLVVGNRGRGGFASLALGSVSVRCVEHATCPVLVIRGEHATTEQ